MGPIDSVVLEWPNDDPATGGDSKDLAALRVQGVLTDEEVAAQKARTLAR